VLALGEAAARAKVGVKTMHEGLRAGKLKGIKVGRLWRVRASDLERFFEESTKRLVLVPADEAEEHP
jgi:excisionase family DNA binding protein